MRTTFNLSMWPALVFVAALAPLAGCDGSSPSGPLDVSGDIAADVSGPDSVDSAPDASPDATADALPDATSDAAIPDVGPGDASADADTEEAVPRPAGWTTETHSNDAEPNLAKVFSDTEVKRIDIVLSAAEWAAMMADMTALYGNPGGSGGGPGGGGPGGGGPGGSTFSDVDPAFVPADILFDGLTWTNVGVRFKGNSSLQSTWTSGNLKLSFKLDFDEFEDQYPEIDNQRFYGFKKLSLKNNYKDTSFVREKVMADLFADAGMVVSHTAFCAVYVDRGAGAEYFGLYTMVEEVDDTVLETQLGDDKGNLYQPDGTAAQFSAGSFDEDELVKENNEDEADFSDVQALLAALHDGSRTSAPATWRQSLDAVFDTDVFLQYLAINGIAQNWDTYGRMSHNYFLYNLPETGRLTWIPWDNNEALQTGNNGGALPLNFSGMSTTQWPLIGFLYADPVYRETYEAYLEATITDGPFTVAAMNARYDVYQPLVQPYATTERAGFTFLTNTAQFNQAFVALRAHAASRVTATKSYLGL
jgi:spore coat protein H